MDVPFSVLMVGGAALVLAVVVAILLRSRHRGRVSAARGRAESALAASIAVWLVATLGGLLWIASAIVVDPSTDEGGHALLALIIWMPQVLAGLLGLVVLVGLRGGDPWAPWLGLVWAVVEIVIGFAGASRLIGLFISVASGGGAIWWYPAESALVLNAEGVPNYTHWQDFVAFALLVVALVGLAAAIALITRHRPSRVAPTGHA